MPGRPGKHRITSSNAIRYRTEKYAAHANHRTCSRPALGDVEDVLVAVAPIVGTVRVVSATTNIAEGLGFVIALAAAELEEEELEELEEEELEAEDED